MADILSDISQDPDITLHILDNYIGSAYSPQVDVTETATGHDVAITYDDAEEGIKTKTFSVPDGQDYVLTQEDRTTIAGIVEDDLDQYIDAMGRATATANQQEQARATAESGRATAEQARQTAETARNSAEGTRTQAEYQRAESERQRAAAEQSRATAETARASAETQRQSSEQARQTAEGARTTAEQARAQAETQRADSESQRASAETSRATAESTRASEWATIKADAQAATTGAENVNATMTKSGTTATVTVTDRTGTEHTATLTDGVSPTARVERVEGGALVTVTDASGTTTAMLNDANGISSAADALMRTPSESTWSRRTSTGSGMARVESVQGAAVTWNQLALTNGAAVTKWGLTVTMDSSTGIVTIAGTATQIGGVNSIGVANTQGHKYLIFGNSSDASMVRFSSQSYGTDSGNGVIITNYSANKMWYYTFQVQAGAVDQAINVTLRPQVYDLTAMFGAGNEPTTVAEFERMFLEAYYPYSAPTLKPVQIAGIESTDAQGGELDSVEWTAQTLRAAGSVADVLYSDHVDVRVGERAYQSGDESDATVRTDGTTTYYPLATPTTTPISPALPMTYRVEQGGTESIVVPDGEVSAAPVITVAEGESASELVMDALSAIATPDGPVATANHAVNTYLTMQGKLYKVTSAIASGEQIVSGTNVTETTVMAEVLSLIQ